MSESVIDDVGAALALMAAPISRTRLEMVLTESGTASVAFERLVREPGTDCAKFLKNCKPARLASEFVRLGGELLELGSSGYPRLLENIRHPPPLLAVAGDLNLLKLPAIGIVGTRRATMTGLNVAFRIGRELAEAGFVVVSGMARGIDTAAHRGALSVEEVDFGRTIGVLGCGIDVVYPRENAGLFEQTLAQALLVSEFGIGSAPEKWRFPVRNRTIAGLCLGVVIVEAFSTGGALSTAAAAREENREVLVVPGSVENPAAAGVIALLRDGAAPIVNGKDVILAVAGFRAELDDNRVREASDGDEDSESSCGCDLETRLIELLSDGVGRSAYDLVDALQIGLRDLLEALEQVIARGDVRRTGGNLFALVRNSDRTTS